MQKLVSALELLSLTTLVHPFPVYFPGHTTTMGLVGAAMMLLQDGDDALIFDGGAWMAPFGVLFKKKEDRSAFLELLEEHGWEFERAGDSALVIANKFSIRS